jgi:hypothetical protein
MFIDASGKLGLGIHEEIMLKYQTEIRLRTVFKWSVIGSEGGML